MNIIWEYFFFAKFRNYICRRIAMIVIQRVTNQKHLLTDRAQET